MRRNELSFRAPSVGCFQYLTWWIAVQRVGSFCSNADRGALWMFHSKSNKQLPPTQCFDSFRMRAQEGLRHSRWQRNYPTASNNGLSSFIHRGLGVASLQQAPTAQQLSGILKYNNALVWLPDVHQLVSWGSCWKITLERHISSCNGNCHLFLSTDKRGTQ